MPKVWIQHKHIWNTEYCERCPNIVGMYWRQTSCHLSLEAEKLAARRGVGIGGIIHDGSAVNPVMNHQPNLILALELYWVCLKMGCP
jgi:hypothetical protein